jgi:hypothetical protein
MGQVACSCALAILAWVVVAERASAGDWELSGGYSMLREANDQVTFPAGWIVGAAGSVNSWLWVTADIDGQRKTVPSIGSDIVLSSHAFLLGGRAATRIGRFTESAQLSAGLLRASGDAFGSSSASSSFAVQPGLGLQYPIAGRWGIRGTVDLRLIHTGEQIRISATLVYAP